jgi:hypothetical protein
VERTKTASTVAALSGQEPMRFGNVNIITFDEDLSAEFVEESEQIGARADRSALYFGKIADGSSRRDLEGVESAHGDRERADMLILLQERPRVMKC